MGPAELASTLRYLAQQIEDGTITVTSSFLVAAPNSSRLEVEFGPVETLPAPFRLKDGHYYRSEKGPVVRVVREEDPFLGPAFVEGGDLVDVWKPNGRPWFSGGRTDQYYGALVEEVAAPSPQPFGLWS